ncbi:hypothetical protein EV183_002129 [Coemansia sp. RSA 2336]|nr:hypothetical protein EV183_002129 [Coemansia sp. RSA 2336]
MFGIGTGNAGKSTFGSSAAGGGGFGGSGGGTSGFGGFGGFGSTSTAPSSGMFGGGNQTQAASSGASMFGSTAASSAAPSLGLFGNAAASSAAAPSTSLFGGTSTSAATTSSGLFGGSGASATTAAAPSTGMFGSTATSTAAPSSGLFGNTATTSAAAPSSGLFGNTTTTSAAAPSSGLFGNTSTSAAAPSTSLFGNTATSSAAAPSSGLFGNTTTASAAAPSSGLFGNTATTSAAAPSSGLFGNASTTSAAAPSTSLFGNTATSAAAAPSTSLFGNTATSAAAPSTSLFGNTAASTTNTNAGNTAAAPSTAAITGKTKFVDLPANIREILTSVEKQKQVQIQIGNTIMADETEKDVKQVGELIQRLAQELEVVKMTLTGDQARVEDAKAQAQFAVKHAEKAASLVAHATDDGSWAQSGLTPLQVANRQKALMALQQDSGEAAAAALLFNQGEMDGKSTTVADPYEAVRRIQFASMHQDVAREYYWSWLERVESSAGLLAERLDQLERHVSSAVARAQAADGVQKRPYDSEPAQRPSPRAVSDVIQYQNDSFLAIAGKVAALDESHDWLRGIVSSAAPASKRHEWDSDSIQRLYEYQSRRLQLRRQRVAALRAQISRREEQIALATQLRDELNDRARLQQPTESIEETQLQSVTKRRRKCQRAETALRSDRLILAKALCSVVGLRLVETDVFAGVDERARLFGLPWPGKDDWTKYPADYINACVGHCIHVFSVLSHYLHLNLPFCIFKRGSRLLVRPNWRQVDEGEAALHEDDRPRFVVGLAMLFYDIAFMCHRQGVRVPVEQVTDAVENMRLVVLALDEPENEAVARLPFTLDVYAVVQEVMRMYSLESEAALQQIHDVLRQLHLCDDTVDAIDFDDDENWAII